MGLQEADLESRDPALAGVLGSQPKGKQATLHLEVWPELPDWESYPRFQDSRSREVQPPTAA